MTKPVRLSILAIVALTALWILWRTADAVYFAPHATLTEELDSVNGMIERFRSNQVAATRQRREARRLAK